MTWAILNTSNTEARKAGLDLLRLRHDYPEWGITWQGGTLWRAVRGGVALTAITSAEMRRRLEGQP